MASLTKILSAVSESRRGYRATNQRDTLVSQGPLRCAYRVWSMKYKSRVSRSFVRALLSDECAKSTPYQPAKHPSRTSQAAHVYGLCYLALQQTLPSMNSFKTLIWECDCFQFSSVARSSRWFAWRIRRFSGTPRLELERFDVGILLPTQNMSLNSVPMAMRT